MNNDKKDICANNHGGADTSKEAFASTKPETRETLKWKILEFIKLRGTATCEAVEQMFALAHQSASARISELLRANKIEITADRDVTKSGRGCRIYKVVE